MNLPTLANTTAFWSIIRALGSAFRGAHGSDIQYIHEDQGTLSEAGGTDAESDDSPVLDDGGATAIEWYQCARQRGRA